jgi:hypothetical protein
MNHSELAHKWAHAAPDASRRSGSMSFAGATLYSYGTPIAQIYRNKRGALVLLSEHNYSVSTSKHLSHARRAVSHLPDLSVPRYMVGAGRTGRYAGSGIAKEDHAANLAHFVAVADDNLKSAQRAQRALAVQWRRDAARRALEDFARYCAHFGIRRKAPAFPELEWNAASSRAHRIENPDPASLDKRERAKAARRAANAARDEYLAEQRRSMLAAKRARDFYRIGAARTIFRLADAFGHDFESLRSSDCILRVEGEQIATSHGARVPLAAAPMVWNLVERARKSGAYKTVFGRAAVQIGDYPLDRIDADGALHAGCHTIPYSELASMARALGLQS